MDTLKGKDVGRCAERYETTSDWQVPNHFYDRISNPFSNRYAVSPEVFPGSVYPTFVIGSFYILDRLYFIDASQFPQELLTL